MEKNQKNCIACGRELTSLGVFENMPSSAQDIPREEELDQDRGITLNLCQCLHCGLVQFPVEPVHYYKDVIRAGGGTRTMINLRHEEYRRLLSLLYKERILQPQILEVGCGRGEFLEMWSSLFSESTGIEIEDSLDREERFAQMWTAGDTETLPDEILRRMQLKLYGIEHKEDLVREAKEKGLDVRRDFAEGEKDLESAPFDAFVQFNFLEHQPKPVDMLRSIHRNLREGGLGLLTVPSFEYILEHDGYYELLRDHIANYTEETLQYVLQEAGFAILSMRRVNRDTIEAIVKKEKTENLSQLCFCGEKLDISTLKENYRELKAYIQDYLGELERAGKSLAIWGASHQGFTLASSTELGGKLQYIIDSAPFKQGRFSPASHIPIVPPEHFLKEPVDEILIVAPGYTEEIASIIRTRFGENVGILVLRGKEIERFSV